jgi:hypothetical protein
MLRGIIALIGAAGLFIYTLVDYVDYANTPEKEPDVERVLSLEEFVEDESIKDGDYLVFPEVHPFWMDSLVEETEYDGGLPYISKIIVPVVTEQQYNLILLSHMIGEPDYSSVKVFMSTLDNMHDKYVELDPETFTGESSGPIEIRGYLDNSNYFLTSAARDIYGDTRAETIAQLYPGLDVENVQLLRYGNLRDYSKGPFDFTLMIFSGLITLVGGGIALFIFLQNRYPKVDVRQPAFGSGTQDLEDDWDTPTKDTRDDWGTPSRDTKDDW